MSKIISTELVTCCLDEVSSEAIKVASGYDFEYQTCDNLFALYETKRGDVIFLNPRPVRDALPTIYPPHYKPFQFTHLRGPARWARDWLQGQKAKAVLRHVGLKARILDGGCGSGVLLRQFRRLIGHNQNLYANDFSADILAPLETEGYKTIVGSLDIIAPAEQFDAITLDQVIEHVENPCAIVKNLGRLLAPGGVLFMETPSIDALDAKLFRQRYWGGYHIPRHFVLFNEQSLRRLVARAGLEVVEVKYLPNPTFWVQSLHHLVLEKLGTGWARLVSDTSALWLGTFALVDWAVLLVTGKTSNIRVIARKPLV